VSPPRAAPPHHCGWRRRAIRLESQAAKVKVTLVDAKRHLVAGWSKTIKKGSAKLGLVLPAKARHTGHDTVQVTVAGKTKTVSVALVA
jgi:hypothetical protein